MRASEIDGDSGARPPARGPPHRLTGRLAALPASCVVIDIYAPSASGREQHHTLALFARASDYDADSGAAAAAATPDLPPTSLTAPPVPVAFFPCKLALCRAPRPLAAAVFRWLERRFDARSSLAPLRLNPRTLFELSAAAMPDILEASESAVKQRGRLSRLRTTAEFRFDLPHAIAARGLSSLTAAVPVKDLQRVVNVYARPPLPAVLLADPTPPPPTLHSATSALATEEGARVGAGSRPRPLVPHPTPPSGIAQREPPPPPPWCRPTSASGSASPSTAPASPACRARSGLPTCPR